jgi:renalase
MTEGTVAIVGAGLAGLACARVLFGAQYTVTVLEKSRGLGGRIATRRVGRLAFDHGAQYLVVRDAGFRDYMDLASATGYAARWQPAGPGLSQREPWHVGVPGMSGIVKPLAAGLDIKRGLKVLKCERREGEWFLKTESGDELGPFAVLLLAVPAPQAVELTRDFTSTLDVEVRLRNVRMAPCWAAMVAYADRLDVPTDVLANQPGMLSWAARDVGKPGRLSTDDCWVLHASPEWTRDHIDDAPTVAAQALVAEFGNRMGVTARAKYFAAHLWRYARVEQPLGEPCVWDANLRFGLCGDWCLDARAEAAWSSGTSLAQHVLATA